MINKIFLAVIAIAAIVMAVLTFLTYSQLQSNGFAPDRIVQNFEYYDTIHKTALWISSLTLLVLANIILWTYRKSWALWSTFAFFAVFILLNMWWFGDSLVDYKKTNNLLNGSFNIGGIIGAVFVVVVGIGIFFNQFLVLRMRDKMFDKPQDNVETIAEKQPEKISEGEIEQTSSEELNTEEESKN